MEPEPDQLHSISNCCHDIVDHDSLRIISHCSDYSDKIVFLKFVKHNGAGSGILALTADYNYYRLPSHGDYFQILTHRGVILPVYTAGTMVVPETLGLETKEYCDYFLYTLSRQ